MNRETLNIDDLLSNSFAAYEPALPAMAWEGIAARLDGDSKKRGFVWWKAAAMVAIIVGAWFAFRSIQQYKHNNHQDHSIQTEQPSSKGGLNGEQPAQNQGNVTPQGSGSDKTIQAGHANQDRTDSKHYNNSHAYQQNPGVEEKATLSGESNTPGNISNPQTDVAASTAANAKTSVKNLVEMGPIGIRPFGISDEDWGKMLARNAESKEVSSNGLPVLPSYKLGSRFMLGLGVGQVVSNTGYAINKQYEHYVHPHFRSEMAKGEGLLSAVNFNASLLYKLGDKSHWSLFTGVAYYQRRNSLDFNFTNVYIGLNQFKTTQDKLGRYPLVQGAQGTPNGRVVYKGTNVFTQAEIPVGIMYQYNISKKWALIPTLSCNIGFMTQKSGKTLDYQYDTVMNIDPSWYRKTYFTMNSSLGIYRNFGSSFKIGVSVSANYMLTPMYVPGFTILPRAFTGGLSTQLMWRLD